jgi:hypothetical protein
VPLPLNYRAKYIADRLALSRLCHEVRARIRAGRSGNPGEFFALRKPHFSFIVDLYSFLRARQPERRVSSRSMSCYATSICRKRRLPLCAIWQATSLRIVLACCTQRSRTTRLSAATSEVQPTDTTSLRLHPGWAVRPALMSRAAHAVESKTVVRRLIRLPITNPADAHSTKKSGLHQPRPYPDSPSSVTSCSTTATTPRPLARHAFDDLHETMQEARRHPRRVAI